MTRVMYDAAAGNAGLIPSNAQYVAGGPKWTDAEWGMFPAAVHVRIAIDPADTAAEVLDVERKYVWPPTNPGIITWLQARRQLGYTGSLYVWLGNLPALRAFVGGQVPGVFYWVADATGIPHEVPGAAATQWCNYRNGPIPAVDQNVISSDTWLTPLS